MTLRWSYNLSYSRSHLHRLRKGPNLLLLLYCCGPLDEIQRQQPTKLLGGLASTTVRSEGGQASSSACYRPSICVAIFQCFLESVGNSFNLFIHLKLRVLPRARLAGSLLHCHLRPLVRVGI